MCHRKKTKVEPDWLMDTSCYPGINHSGEIELEEYIWSIHKDIDFALFNILLKEGIESTAGIKVNQDMDPGYIYAPYVPIMVPPTKKTYTIKVKDIPKRLIDKYIKKIANDIKNGPTIFGKE